MRRLNKIFTLSSLSVLLVTIERFSFTTKILLPPHNFLRLHELIQMTVLILITVVVPFLLLREVTSNFESLKTKKGFWLGLIFVVGIYFYATGNGVHEVASFYFNDRCDISAFTSDLCHSFFINDYYTGNILYFLGAVMMTVPLLLFESEKASPAFKKPDLIVLVVNALIYSFAIFAYAAFDRVLVGLIYTITMAIVAFYFFLLTKRQLFRYPLILYTIITYTVGAVGAFVVKIFF